MTTATARIGGAPRPVSIPGTFALLLGAFAALHAAMLAYDLFNPERFFAADRALSRWQTVQGFMQVWHSGGDVAGFLAAHGIVGDWLAHAALALAGGPLLIILVQVLLALASIVWVRELGLRLALPEGKAAGAAALYGILPHTLVLPHQLSSEAIFLPLVILSFVIVMRGMAAPRHGAAGLVMGLAALVRPVVMLWPLVHALFARRASTAARLAYLLAGLAPLALWVAFIHAQTGELSMGRSKHDLGHNLYLRVQRMAPQLAPSERFADRAEPRIGVGEYLNFVARHPGAAAAHLGRDFLTLGFKSGIERVVIDYLNLVPQAHALQDPARGWRKRFEQGGAAEVLRYVLRENAGLAVASLAGAAAFALVMALALVGAYVFLRTGRYMLVAYVAYVFLTATVVDAAQSRSRAPGEFALCLLALTGLWALQRRHDPGPQRQKRRREPPRESRIEPTLGREPTAADGG